MWMSEWSGGDRVVVVVRRLSAVWRNRRRARHQDLASSKVGGIVAISSAPAHQLALHEFLAKGLEGGAVAGDI